MIAPNWSLRLLAALAVVAAASRADAQQFGQPNPPQIIVFPQVNGIPGLPANLFNPPAFNPGPAFNPALNNPFLNQTNVIPYNPFAPNPFNNPFINNPFNPHPLTPNPFAPNPFSTFTTATPPLAFQQPGQLLYRGPNLQVNPISGMVYRPLSGIARTADGGTFYYVPGTGLPTVTGAYSPGSGLYFDPARNTFLNPATGVISRPGVTNVFVPWIR